ncbi:MAG TPA: hypothetical protein VF469_27210 [Kofleriaceae bacterium]
MLDADTLETINREQLATATDRLLLGGRLARRRRSLACGSQSIAPSVPRPLDPRQERTIPVRRRALPAQRSGSAVALAVRF